MKLIFACGSKRNCFGTLILSKGALWILLIMVSFNGMGQTTVFSDDFNRTSVSPGGTPVMTYTLTNTGAGNSTIQSSPASGTEPFLRINNGNPAGRSYVSGSLSTFSAPYNTTLSSNSGLIAWSFNIRHNRTSNLGGFNAGAYGAAVVLVASGSDFLAAGCTGYAIANGGNSSYDYRLVKFTGGLSNSANLTTLISGLLPSNRNDYMSIKVTYDPLTSTFKLYERRDGAYNGSTPPSLWLDPSALGESNLIGMYSDNTYTGVNMSSFGYLWNYSTSAGQYLFIDNFKVTHTPIVLPSLNVFPTTLSGFYYTEGSGSSQVQICDLTGSNLVGFPANISLTGSDHYEVSADGDNYSTTATYQYVASTFGPKPIYIRLKSGLAAGVYNNENIIITAAGATPVLLNCSGFVLSLPQVYSWTGAASTDWQVPANWSPVRTNPIITDILQFSDGGSHVVTNVPTQTVGKIAVINGTEVDLQTSYSATITIAGLNGDDLWVSGAASALNLSGTTPVTLTLGPGATGLIEGSMSFSQAAHRLTASDTSAVQFLNGSAFIATTGLTGNPFGTVNLNTIIFNSGSMYLQNAGSNPFGASQPNTVVKFKKGSLLKYTASSGAPAFSGRTYADFEYNAPATVQNPTGNSPLICDNFTVTSGSVNFNFTGGITIKGNISVAAGASLTFGNLSSPTILMMTGDSPQSISGDGTLIFGDNSTFSMNNENGLSLQRNVSFKNVNLFLGVIDAGVYTMTLTGTLSGGSTAAYVNGKLSRIINATGPWGFPVGKGGYYRPVTLNYTSFDAPGTVTVEQIESALTGITEPGTTIFPARYWNITQTGSNVFTYDIILDGTGYTPSASPRIIKKDGSILISYPAVYNNPNFSITNLTSFSDFAIGEYTPLPNLVISGTLTPFSTTVGTPSLSQFYVIQGSNMTGNLVVTAPSNFEISNSETGPYVGALTFTPINGSLSLTPVYIRFNPVSGGVHNGIITNTTLGYSGNNVAVTGIGLIQSLMLNPTTLNPYTYVQGFGPSSSQTITLNASGLFGNVVISAPVHYQVSLSAVSGYATSLSLTPVAGNVGPLNIYVRMITGLSQGTYNNEQIMVSSLYAVPQYLNCNGTVTPPPVISTSLTSLSGFSYIWGSGPSNTKTFTVSGQYLVGNINMSAPVHYEISLTQNSGFGPNLSITQNGGIVLTTTVYVRLKAGLNAGLYNNENVSIISSGAVNKIVSCNGTVFNLPVITVNPAVLSGFSYIIGFGPSVSQVLYVSGTNLQNAVMVAAPANYEVSSVSTGNYYPNIYLIPTSGTLSQTPVYVRLKSGLPIGSYNNETVTFSSTGALDKQILCSGTVLAEPVPTLSVNSVDAFGDVCVNTQFGPEQVFISGTTLTNAPISIEAPEGFLVSLSSNGPFISSLTVNQPGGIFSSSFFVMFTPTQSQFYDDQVIVSGGGAPAVFSGVQGNGIDNPPTVITLYPPSDVTGSTANCSGNVTEPGCNNVTVIGICYGTDPVPDTNGMKTIEPGTNGLFSSQLSGLFPATLYYYRAYALSTSGLSYGDVFQFTNLPVLPVVLTLDASLLTATTASLYGIVNARNSTTEIFFEYGPDTGYGSTIAAMPSTVAGFDDQEAFAEISGLEPNMIYHYRIVATNAAGTVVGNDIEFQTMTMAPVVQTLDASQNCGAFASLHGEVKASNQTASVYFEYGPTEEYGFSANAVPENISGNAFVPVSVQLSGLDVNSFYHFRVVAANETGITYGDDKVFTTNQLPGVEAGPGAVIPYLGSVQLDGVVLSGVPPFQYFWSPAVSVSDPVILDPVASPLTTTVFTLAVMDGNGCLGTDSVLITVQPPTDTIAGTVKYDNNAGTPMNNTVVYLKDQNGNIISSTTTNASGHYSFAGVSAGQYQLKATTTKTWDGANATDALIVLRHFTGMVQLTGLPLLAANVTTDQFVNSLDALLISRRFIQVLTSFPVGDWVFSSPNIIVAGQGITQTVNLKALCYGDVNRSHTPGAKIQPSVSIIREGSISVKPEEVINIPVSFTRDANVGAVSLSLEFPSGILSVQDVRLAKSSEGALLFNTQEGKLNISWFSLNPLVVNAGEAILYIAAAVKNADNLDKMQISVCQGSEISDINSLIINDMNITIPNLHPFEDRIELHTFPNPFSVQATVDFYLPQQGSVSLTVYDLTGRERMKLIHNENYPEGIHQLTIDELNLPAGMYALKLEITGQGRIQSVTNRLIISK